MLLKSINTVVYSDLSLCFEFRNFFTIIILISVDLSVCSVKIYLTTSLINDNINC